MNLKELHGAIKEVSAVPFFNGEVGKTIAIQLQQNGKLKEHITKTPAMLLCVIGTVIYEDENKQKVELKSGDYFEIKPNVKHWLEALDVSELILMK